MPIRRARNGAPLRALAALGVALAVYEGSRLPRLARDFAVERAAFAAAAQEPGRAVEHRAARPAPNLPFVTPAKAGVHRANDAVMDPRFRGGDEREERRSVFSRSAQRIVPAATLPAAIVPAEMVIGERVATSDTAPTVASSEPPGATPVVPTALQRSSPGRRRILRARPQTPAVAYTLASFAFTRAAHGDVRGAARAFDAALAADPAHGSAEAWRAARGRLDRHWGGEAYWLLREGDASRNLIASPLLGAGQAGAGLHYSFNPLGRRPLAIVVRAAIAASPKTRGLLPRSLSASSAQFAIGARWQPVRGFSITAERLIAGGYAARNDWNLRLAGGVSGARGRILWSGYGEAGALASGDSYAAGQARLTLRVADIGPVRLTGGGGVWGSIQHADTTLDRVDAGPTVGVHIAAGRVGFDLSADYRFRLAGNVAPRSGPVVTVSAAF